MPDPNLLCLGCMNERKSVNEECQICGWNNKTGKNKAHQLKPGTILQGKYLVGKVIGEGGFGITYLGWNLLLQEKIAIKEFYPHGLVGRDADVRSTVIPYAGKESIMEKAKDGFIKEAKTIYGLNHISGVVEMKDIFAENQTVYLVMNYVEGRTLREYAKEHGGKLSASIAIKLLEPIMDALEQVHANNLIHRDVSPDNIIISSVGKVTLLDFGAARQISADGEHSLTIEVKHGYAPFEQYQIHGKQGPWTDIYALCATIYRLITGETPPSTPDRIIEDPLELPSKLGADITPEQEKVLMKGLAVRIEERYLNICELKTAFKYTEKKSEQKTDAAAQKAIEKIEKKKPEISAEAEKEKIDKNGIDAKAANKRQQEIIEMIEAEKRRVKREELLTNLIIGGVILVGIISVLIFRTI